jgi:hypothetical protein
MKNKNLITPSTNHPAESNNAFVGLQNRPSRDRDRDRHRSTSSRSSSPAMSFSRDRSKQTKIHVEKKSNTKQLTSKLNNREINKSSKRKHDLIEQKLGKQKQTNINALPTMLYKSMFVCLYFRFEFVNV